MTVRIICADAMAALKDMPERSVHTCVTSPPYWGLRDYGIGPDALGLEPTPELYVEHIVQVIREVRRVLRDDGTLWLNLGDSYAGSPAGNTDYGPYWKTGGIKNAEASYRKDLPKSYGVLKPKDLCGIPWRVAFALQADGWWLRSDIVWSKPNPMPESVTDRPTRSHEYLFLLAKKARYYYDADAIREPAEWAHWGEQTTPKYGGSDTQSGWIGQRGVKDRALLNGSGRNKRSVWEIPTQPYPGAHFAVFPEKLVEPCILAGCPQGGNVLDCFSGSGTVGLVAERLGRHSVLIDANEDYCQMARERTAQIGLML